MSIGECRTRNELNLFLTSDLLPAERDSIELHLSRCGKCRRLLTMLYDGSTKHAITAQVPGRLKARVLRIPSKRDVLFPRLIPIFRHRIAAGLIGVTLVAFGIAGFMLFTESRHTRQLASPDALRQESSLSPAPQLFAPGPGTTITAEDIAFSWSPVQGAVGFTLTLLDPKGEIVFQTFTQNQGVVLNGSSEHLQRGSSYFWYVGAKLQDGTIIESPISKFALK